MAPHVNTCLPQKSGCGEESQVGYKEALVKWEAADRSLDLHHSLEPSLIWGQGGVGGELPGARDASRSRVNDESLHIARKLHHVIGY